MHVVELPEVYEAEGRMSLPDGLLSRSQTFFAKAYLAKTLAAFGKTFVRTFVTFSDNIRVTEVADIKITQYWYFISFPKVY